MIRPVKQRYLDIYNRITGQDAGIQSPPYTLSVCNLRLTHIGINLELSEHPVNNDLKMQLSHTGDYSLTCFLISLNPERRVFLSQLLQGHTTPFLLCLCLGLYCNAYYRLRKLHLLEYYRILLVTQSISRSCAFQTDCCCNIAGIYSLYLFPLVGMHLKDTPYPL